MEEEKKVEDTTLGVSEDKTSQNEDLAKKIASLEAQKEHFRKKYQQAKEVLSNVSFDDEEEEKKEVKEVKSNVSENERLDILDFSIQHKELTRDDVLKINKYAKSLGITMEQALQDDFIKAGVEDSKKRQASSEAQFDSNRSPRSKSSKKLQYKPNMTRDEFKNLLKENGLL
jgi:outer membrane protein assembly factor BamA